ncbi:MAG: molecular chaperone HtpG [Bacteroides sp.]
MSNAQTGKIGVTTENIFPIIKKFLYSDHEIFLRELISNAVDATQKLRTLASAGEFKGEIGDETIEVILDSAANTLTVRDHGLGMTREEVERYINQIALSGAEEFLAKFKDKEASIIGHFGLGFYSAFMVSDRVEIETKSWQEGAEPVHWSCEGDPTYTLEQGTRTERGTDIILHLSPDCKEFSEQNKIRDLLRKYCRFLPVPIACGFKTEWKDGKSVETTEHNIINSEPPLWVKRPADLKEEDYLKFYRYLFPGQEDPLFHIHLNVDYPFNLTGILYFPKMKSNFDIQRNRIQLYCNQVFVTDSVEGVVPEFLTVLHGVIDSPDIPLNVSRSYLQSDANVRKISSHITKKVADRLEEIFKEDRKAYESKWEDLKLFVDYGSISNEKFWERAEKFALVRDVDGNFFTYEEYQKAVEEKQKNKDGKTVYLYTTDPEQQWGYIEEAKGRGYSVLQMTGQLDAHLINFLEQKLTDVQFARVDADTLDRLIEKGEERKVALSETEQNSLIGVMTGALGDRRTQFSVSLEDLGAEGLPAVVTQSEFMRRMRDMAQMSPQYNMFANFPEHINIVLNTAHPLVTKLSKTVTEALGTKLEDLATREKPALDEEKALEEKLGNRTPSDQTDEEKAEHKRIHEQLEVFTNERNELLNGYGATNALAQQLIDLALLSNNMLKGEALAKFVRRSAELLG